MLGRFILQIKDGVYLDRFHFEEVQGQLTKIGLYYIVWAVQHGIPPSHFHFFSILELGTFFTSVGEMGLAFHQLYEVSSLPMGELPYEEYVPTEEDLDLLKAQNTLAYDTYWELMCYFHICGQMTKLRNQDVKQKA